MCLDVGIGCGVALAGQLAKARRGGGQEGRGKRQGRGPAVRTAGDTSVTLHPWGPAPAPSISQVESAHEMCERSRAYSLNPHRARSGEVVTDPYECDAGGHETLPEGYEAMPDRSELGESASRPTAPYRLGTSKTYPYPRTVRIKLPWRDGPPRRRRNRCM